MAVAKLKQALAYRQDIIDQVHEIQNIAQQAHLKDEPYDFLYIELKTRYLNLKTLFQDFNTQHVVILGIICTQDGADMRTQTAVREEFQKDYYTIKSIYFDLFENPPLDPPLTKTATSHVKLPRLELSKFSGDVKNWKSFLDMFDSTIHENATLSPIEKFNFLTSCLEGAPLSLVQCLPKSSANYQIAYNTLLKRYDNARLLAASHWNAIDNYAKVTDAIASSQTLRKLINVFTENIAALKNLGHNVDQWDFVFFHMLLKRLNTETVTRFELANISTETPSFKLLTDFVTKQCDALESVSFMHESPAKKPQSSTRVLNSFSRPRQGSSFVVKVDRACSLCSNDHLIYTCPEFLSKSPKDRYTIVKKHKWCINCLGDKHQLKACSSTSTCRTCNQNHHSLLHFSSDRSLPSISTSPSTSQDITSLTSLIPVHSTVLLSTAVVDIRDRVGNIQPVRVLLDNASQANFMTEKCASRLGLIQQTLSFTISGLGTMQTKASKGVSCTFYPRNVSDPKFMIDAVVLPEVCGKMPSSSFTHQRWAHISNIKLADPQFNVSHAIDMLLGADVFAQLIESGQIVGAKNEPVALNTKLGWILMGNVNFNSCSITSSLNAFCTTIQEAPLDAIVKKFWEIEEIPAVPFISADDLQAEIIFSKAIRVTLTVDL